MSHFSQIDIDMANLRADVKALEARMIIERDVADYWYNRCQDLEVKLNDEVNNRPACKTGQ